MTFELKSLIQLGGILHFVIVGIAVWVPRVLDWKHNLGVLSPFMRHLFWVYAVYIMFVVASMGAFSLFFADFLASGVPAARALCGFIAVFWLGRLFVQFFVFDITSVVKHWFFRAGFHVLTVLFVLLSCGVYLWAALR